MKQKTIFAVLLLCLTIGAVTFAGTKKYDPLKGKIVSSLTEDEPLTSEEQQAVDVAHDTWVSDGMPFDPGIPPANTQEWHYCRFVSEPFMSRENRMAWVLSQMGGWGNPNHVHYISFYKAEHCVSDPGGNGCYMAIVTIWTNGWCGGVDLKHAGR